MKFFNRLKQFIASRRSPSAMVPSVTVTNIESRWTESEPYPINNVRWENGVAIVTPPTFDATSGVSVSYLEKETEIQKDEDDGYTTFPRKGSTVVPTFTVVQRTR